MKYEGNVSGAGELQVDGSLKGDVRVSRVVIGTKALEKDFLKKAVSKFKEKIAVGLDVRHDLVFRHPYRNSMSGNACPADKDSR